VAISPDPKAVTVYLVRALWHGRNDRHSYIVGVYSTRKKAQEAANIKKYYREGKYDCEIQDWIIDQGTEGD